MNIAKYLRKARNFARSPWFEKVWLLPVWLLLGLSRLLIMVVPFRKLAYRLGVHAGTAPWLPLVGPACEARALSIAKVVQMAARNTPWESNCFPQAITARVLLGLYGIPYSLFFGVARNADANLKAHAWVAAGRVRVAGGTSFGQFTVVACFISPCLASEMRQAARNNMMKVSCE